MTSTFLFYFILSYFIYFYFILFYFCRDGIATDTLDEVERAFVHPKLVASVEGNTETDVSDGIGS